MAASIDVAADHSDGRSKKVDSWRFLDVQLRYGEADGLRLAWCKYKTSCFVCFLLIVHVGVYTLLIVLFISENGIAHSLLCYAVVLMYVIVGLFSLLGLSLDFVWL